MPIDAPAPESPARPSLGEARLLRTARPTRWGGALLAAARRLLDAVLTLVGWVVAPDRCAGCDGALEGGASFCAPCTGSVVREGSSADPGGGAHGTAAHEGAGADPGGGAHGTAAHEGSSADPGGGAHGAAAHEGAGEDLGGSTPAKVVAYAVYEGAVAAAVRRFKYGGRADLARPLGAMLVEAARAARVSGDVVVPVPLHGRKLRERGYNQAALLANVLGRGLGARVAAGALSRTRGTVAQASLERSERLRNLDGAFRANGARLVRGKRVLLVDDVTTTGATLAACRSALLDAGAAHVVAVVLARVHDERPPAARRRRARSP